MTCGKAKQLPQLLELIVGTSVDRLKTGHILALFSSQPHGYTELAQGEKQAYGDLFWPLVILQSPHLWSLLSFHS